MKFSSSPARVRAVSAAASREHEHAAMQRRHIEHRNLARLEQAIYVWTSEIDVVHKLTARKWFVAAADAFVAEHGAQHLSYYLTHALTVERSIITEGEREICLGCDGAGKVRTSPDDADTCLSCDGHGTHRVVVA